MEFLGQKTLKRGATAVLPLLGCCTLYFETTIARVGVGSIVGARRARC